MVAASPIGLPPGLQRSQAVSSDAASSSNPAALEGKFRKEGQSLVGASTAAASDLPQKQCRLTDADAEIPGSALNLMKTPAGGDPSQIKEELKDSDEPCDPENLFANIDWYR